MKHQEKINKVSSVYSKAPFFLVIAILLAALVLTLVALGVQTYRLEELKSSLSPTTATETQITTSATASSSQRQITKPVDPKRTPTPTTKPTEPKKTTSPVETTTTTTVQPNLKSENVLSNTEWVIKAIVSGDTRLSIDDLKNQLSETDYKNILYHIKFSNTDLTLLVNDQERFTRPYHQTIPLSWATEDDQIKLTLFSEDTLKVDVNGQAMLMGRVKEDGV